MNGETAASEIGPLVLVVGPSGAGKDTLMMAAAAARRDVVIARRAITRPARAGDEDHEPMSEAAFEARVAAGAFALHWRAHGLSYGIPASLDLDRTAGRTVLANVSRRILADARAMFPDMTVLHVTARPEVLAARLTGRGREDASEVAARLARSAAPPMGPDVVDVDNSGDLDAGVAAFLAALPPARARLSRSRVDGGEA